MKFWSWKFNNQIRNSKKDSTVEQNRKKESADERDKKSLTCEVGKVCKNFKRYRIL